MPPAIFFGFLTELDGIYVKCWNETIYHIATMQHANIGSHPKTIVESLSTWSIYFTLALLVIQMTNIWYQMSNLSLESLAAQV